MPPFVPVSHPPPEPPPHTRSEEIPQHPPAMDAPQLSLVSAQENPAPGLCSAGSAFVPAGRVAKHWAFPHEDELEEAQDRVLCSGRLSMWSEQSHPTLRAT